MIAKKFILSILLCAGIIGTGSPMKRTLKEANQNEQKQVIQTQGQVSEDDFNSIIADVFHQLYDQGCRDIIVVIACHLDGKSFTALTLSCKYIQNICNKIPTHSLINTNFAEAACSGNTSLLGRFLNTKPIDPTFTNPTVIKNLCSCESKAGKIELCTVLIGTQQVYKTIYKLNNASDTCIYTALIDMGNDDFIFLIRMTKQAIEADSFFPEQDTDNIQKKILDDLRNSKFSDLVIGDFLITLESIVNDVRETYLEQKKEDLLIIAFSSREKDTTHSAYIYPKNSNEDFTAFLNIQIIFMIAARKNYAAMIDLFLKKFGQDLTSFSLITAHELTTNPTIKAAIKKEIDLREYSDQEESSDH